MGFATRPTVRGRGGAVAAGHYLAAEIGARMLAAGGNAADAACAMGFALEVLEPTQNGPCGECPIVVWEAASERAHAISGQGPVPAAIVAWCLLLERFGTRRFEEVVAPARELAARGFPMYPFLRGLLCFVEP